MKREVVGAADGHEAVLVKDSNPFRVSDKLFSLFWIRTTDSGPMCLLCYLVYGTLEPHQRRLGASNSNGYNGAGTRPVHSAKEKAKPL